MMKPPALPCQNLFFTNVRKIALIVLGLSVTAHAQTTSLNGTWRFRTDPNDAGTQQAWFRPEASTTNWDSLPVPGNWDLRNEYAHYVGKGWYRRTFATPTNLTNKVARLYFEAVYHDCTVWLNGRKLGENHSGFLSFEYDVTKLLNSGGTNTLVVCADNALTRGATWNWGGIRRPVSLIVSEPIRVVRQHITPIVDLVRKSATVAIRVFVQNHQNQPADVSGITLLTAPNGFTRTLPFRVSVPGSGSASVVVQTALSPKETHLWHFDDPFLYTAQTNLANGGQQTNRFGLRKVDVDNNAFTLKLNGEVVRPMGFNLVPDDRTTGNTLPLWRVKEDVDLLKSLNCTMTRLSHLCLPEEMLDYLDERGMLVIAEIPLWGYDPRANPADTTARNWLTRLVTNQYNHPSIVGWSVGNEIGYYPTVFDYVKGAVDYARTLDSTRLVSSVSHTAQYANDHVKLGDIGLVNRYGANLGPATRQIHNMHPNRTLFYTEYGVSQFAENLDASFNAKLLVDSIRNLPYLIGGSLWTFNDYRSRFNGTKEPSENRAWGVVDVYRRKKRAYYDVRREYSPLRSIDVRTGSATTAAVTLVPRGRLDLPAYPLHGYRLLWHRTDAQGIIGQSGLVPLADIRPGDAPQQFTLNWQADSAHALTVELLAPTGDVVADTTLFLRPPTPVRMTYALGGRTNYNNANPGGTLRVQFQPNPTATTYKVRYGETDLSQETPATTGDFIDIPKLTLGKTYRLAVVGINNAGETQSTDVKRVKVDTLHIAPPVIQHVEPADGGFFLGYASPEDNYLYRVQVTTRPGQYADARTIQSPTAGTLFVPGLTNGQTYGFRFQSVKDNWGNSNWSEERTVTPDGGQRPGVPVLRGVVRGAREAVVCFEPVRKATGYTLEYRAGNAGSWTKQAIPTAQTGRYVLTGLDPKQSYQYRLAAQNPAGQSAFSTVSTVQPNAKIQRHR